MVTLAWRARPTTKAHPVFRILDRSSTMMTLARCHCGTEQAEQLANHQLSRTAKGPCR